MDHSAISINNLNFNYGKLKVVDEVSLEIPRAAACFR